MSESEILALLTLISRQQLAILQLESLVAELKKPQKEEER